MLEQIRAYVEKLDGTVIAEKFVDLPSDWDEMSSTAGSMHLRELAEEFRLANVNWGASVVPKETSKVPPPICPQCSQEITGVAAEQPPWEPDSLFDPSLDPGVKICTPGPMVTYTYQPCGCKERRAACS